MTVSKHANAPRFLLHSINTNGNYDPFQLKATWRVPNRGRFVTCGHTTVPLTVMYLRMAVGRLLISLDHSSLRIGSRLDDFPIHGHDTTSVGPKAAG